MMLSLTLLATASTCPPDGRGLTPLEEELPALARDAFWGPLVRGAHTSSREASVSAGITTGRFLIERETPLPTLKLSPPLPPPWSAELTVTLSGRSPWCAELIVEGFPDPQVIQLDGPKVRVSLRVRKRGKVLHSESHHVAFWGESEGWLSFARSENGDVALTVPVAADAAPRGDSDSILSYLDAFKIRSAEALLGTTDRAWRERLAEAWADSIERDLAVGSTVTSAARVLAQVSRDGFAESSNQRIDQVLSRAGFGRPTELAEDPAWLEFPSDARWNEVWVAGRQYALARGGSGLRRLAVRVPTSGGTKLSLVRATSAVAAIEAKGFWTVLLPGKTYRFDAAGFVGASGRSCVATEALEGSVALLDFAHVISSPSVSAHEEHRLSLHVKMPETNQARVARFVAPFRVAEPGRYVFTETESGVSLAHQAEASCPR